MAQQVVFSYNEIMDYARSSVTYHSKKWKGFLSSEDIEDTIQEVAIKAWRKADTFNPEKSSLRTWIGYIAFSTFIDAIRRKKREAEHFEGFTYDSEGEEVTPYEITGYRGDEYNADKAVEMEEAFEAIEEVVASLSDTQQRVYKCLYEDKTAEEIADELGVDLRKAYYYVYSTRKALRKKLEQE